MLHNKLSWELTKTAKTLFNQLNKNRHDERFKLLIKLVSISIVFDFSCFETHRLHRLVLVVDICAILGSYNHGNYQSYHFLLQG